DDPRRKKPESAEADSGFFAFKGLGFPLENEFQAKLNVSRPTRADHRIRRRYVRSGSGKSKSGRDRRVHIEQCRGLRAREVRVVRHVEEFGARLHGYSFSKMCVFTR